MPKRQIFILFEVMRDFEKPINLINCYQHDLPEAGVDEAGRGCFAGPVAAAAVILPEGFYHPLLNDSKKMSAADRQMLRPIIEKEAICWQVALVFPDRIDRINILQATYEAMHLCISRLCPSPSLLAVDGKWFRPYAGIKHICCIGGDAIYTHIAAASILAKTHRDEYMENLHEQFPMYNWKQNKGYGSVEHRRAIAEHGISPHHRKSFSMASCQPELFSDLAV